MSARARAFRALPFTFLLYIFEAALSTLSGLPLGLESLRQLASSRWDETQAALTLESLRELAPATRVATGSTLLAAAFLMLLSPWLQMSWYAALGDSLRPLRALADGARRILRAWLVSILIGLVSALASVPFLLIAWGVHNGLKGSTDARLHDLALWASLAPLLPLAVSSWLAHDLARAGALRSSAWHSSWRALGMLRRGRVLLRGLVLTLVGYGAVLLVAWQSWLMPQISLRFMITAFALQSALLARFFLRSLWLANALTCMAPELEPGPAKA